MGCRLNIKILSKMLEYIFRDRRSAIDKFMQTHFKRVSNKAFKEKRGLEGATIYLNELITPDAFEVKKFKKKHLRYFKEKLLFMRKIGNELAKFTAWFDESSLDYNDFYLFPRETLTEYKSQCDCEDLAFIMTSFDPDNCAVAFGKWLPEVEQSSTKVRGESSSPNGNVIWHSFPVFLFQGDMYTVETTGKTASFRKLNDTVYIPYLIVTQYNTYKVRDGVKFGKEEYI